MEYKLVLLLQCLWLFTFLELHMVNLRRVRCQSNSTDAICSNQNLGHIPYELHHTIRRLDLNHNNLKVLEMHSFGKYDSLTHLYLQNNSISVIRGKAFKQLGNLLVLDLSNNQLELKVLPTTIFEGLTSLRELNLKGNMISEIKNAAFSNLINLRSLLLHGNYIETISVDAFKGLDYLENLELQHNQIKMLEQGVEKYFTHRFKMLRIYNNPWICDCHNSWFEDYLIRHHSNITGETPFQWIFLEGEPKCNGPSHLRGRLFSDLNTGDFVCKINMFSSGYDMPTKLGGQAELVCKYGANPHVNPIWSKDGSEIHIQESTDKFKISNNQESYVTSILTINDFSVGDSGEYMCSVHNARGEKYIKFAVSLDGADPSSPLTSFPLANDSDNSPQNSHTVTIALSVIGGFVFLIIVMGVIIYSVTRCRRKQRKKSEERSMMFKEHLKTNVLNQSEITENNKELEKAEHIVLTDTDEHDPLYDHVAHHNHINANTYVSFQQEFGEPEEMHQLYSTSTVNRTKGSDGSQCESTSPLLDNCSPIMCNSHDLLYETSNGSTIYTPAILPRANTLNSRYLPPMSSYDTYLSYTPYSTLSHCGGPRSTSTPPPMTMRSKSASANYIGPVVPPKKPPRIFNSGDSMSQTSSCGSENMHPLKFSLPKPGTVDEYGTAV